jgi:hypothetical protein
MKREITIFQTIREMPEFMPFYWYLYHPFWLVLSCPATKAIVTTLTIEEGRAASKSHH